MPVTDNTSSDFKPDFHANPNVRYASTFLSTGYRDYAVKGENIIDKNTGEIFIKRPVDGRVISFFQNKKYMHELLSNFQILINNNADFKFPEETNLEAYYSNIDYDLVAINDEKENDILTTPVYNFKNLDPNKKYHMIFNLAKDTNGFFIRLTSRDCDKPIIAYMIAEYNKQVKNYNGDNEIILNEKKKFENIENWLDCDTIITYEVSIRSSNLAKTYSCTDYVHINEDCLLLLPIDDINNDFPNGYDKAIIEISSVNYHKINFMNTNKNLWDSTYNECYKELVVADNGVMIPYLNIGRCVNNASDIDLNGNEFIVALIDIPYLRRFMMKVSKLRETSDFIVSPNRPDPQLWPTNGLWAEVIRTVSEGGVITDEYAVTNLEKLDRYLADDTNNRMLSMTEDSYRTDDIYLFDPSKSTYTKEEVNAKMERLDAYVSAETEKMVSTNQYDVSDEGLYLEPKEVK